MPSPSAYDDVRERHDGVDRHVIDCPRCGKFAISGTAFAVASQSDQDLKLSAWLRSRQGSGEIPFVGSATPEQVKSGIPSYSVGEKQTPALKTIATRSQHAGKAVTLAPHLVVGAAMANQEPFDRDPPPPNGSQWAGHKPGDEHDTQARSTRGDGPCTSGGAPRARVCRWNAPAAHDRSTGAALAVLRRRHRARVLDIPDTCALVFRISRSLARSRAVWRFAVNVIFIGMLACWRRPKIDPPMRVVPIQI